MDFFLNPYIMKGRSRAKKYNSKKVMFCYIFYVIRKGIFRKKKRKIDFFF